MLNVSCEVLNPRKKQSLKSEAGRKSISKKYQLGKDGEKKCSLSYNIIICGQDRKKQLASLNKTKLIKSLKKLKDRDVPSVANKTALRQTP